jgi:hypothetical protein
MTKNTQSNWLKRQIMFYLKEHSDFELRKLVEWCIGHEDAWEKQQEKEIMKLIKNALQKND